MPGASILQISELRRQDRMVFFFFIQAPLPKDHKDLGPAVSQDPRTVNSPAAPRSSPPQVDHSHTHSVALTARGCPHLDSTLSGAPSTVSHPDPLRTQKPLSPAEMNPWFEEHAPPTCWGVGVQQRLPQRESSQGPRTLGSSPEVVPGMY